MEERVILWAQKNDRLYAQAIGTLAKFIIEDLEIKTQEDYDCCEIESAVALYWREYLDNEELDELKDALEERIAVAKVVDKDCLGGGGWEAERDIQIDTCKRIKKIINF